MDMYRRLQKSRVVSLITGNVADYESRVTGG
jgi:hypothetical protein